MNKDNFFKEQINDILSHLYNVGDIVDYIFENGDNIDLTDDDIEELENIRDISYELFNRVFDKYDETFNLLDK